ncbi:DNA methyltransferase [Coprobacter fastidiosus]|mgnify:FL=1|uniref:DNA methyltransferase n=1 Tax=Coprobacter fastidiosus TaxID=1099853 RepID=UPI0003364EEC|nr:DNA methyltransferase [Coprobacter fastidiosus]RHO52749.1 site-specific DNA-methyltransferase [Tannerella sp. AM09-19]CDD88632.1 dNA methylase N-4/N-6 domain protein [Tannerella sp. CAG:51]
MASDFAKANLTVISDTQLKNLTDSYDAIILNTSFEVNDIGKTSNEAQILEFVNQTIKTIDIAKNLLKDGGLLFVYGLTNYLAYFGEYLDKLNNQEKVDYHYLFKYWIACEFGVSATENSIPTSHIGLLMYLKSKSKKSVTPFNLNTKFVRIPYKNCIHCGQNTKDWGGKKHLLNPLGTAISDVWHFIEFPVKDANKLPKPVIDRILLLLSEGNEVLAVEQTTESLNLPKQEENISIFEPQKQIDHLDTVVHSDCIAYLKNLKEKYPQGSFDLAFADPPYNLAKNYSTYKDDKEDQKYINWCNEWLGGMCDNLKPGGSLLVLNIPKWAIHHFTFLNKRLLFKNWIVWDALSTPAGKLLPAHYSLLYFVKEGGIPTVNIDKLQYIDSRDYCLRAKCVKERKDSGDDKKELLSDIWQDVYRIKHKKDRDHHPCQLPTKLMERIIELFTNEGDVIFDPFGGAGTSAIAAKLLGRHYVITELDKNYVEIAKKNISKVVPDLMGNLYYQRESVSNAPKPTNLAKNQFEKKYINLCIKKEKVLNSEDLKNEHSELFTLLSDYSGDFNKLQTFVKRQMEYLNQKEL